MSADAAPPQDPAEAAVGRAERRIAKMARLSDKGLEVTDAIVADGSPASAASYAKASRAVRLTIKLEDLLDNALSARLAGAAPTAPTERADVAGAEAFADPFARVRSGAAGEARRLVVDVIDREAPDADDWENLADALDERLLFDQAYAGLDDRPLRDVVERLCADLGLDPDWDRWAGDGWAPPPPFSRPLHSPFAAPSRRPVLVGEDRDPDPPSRE